MNFLNISRILLKTEKISTLCPAHTYTAAKSKETTEMRCLMDEKNLPKIVIFWPKHASLFEIRG